LSPRIIALAAAGLTAAAVATPVLAQSGGGGKTITFHELNKGSRFGYVDNPPRNKPHRRPVFSIGDQFVLANPLAGTNGRIGELRATCALTKRAPATDNGFTAAHPFCTGAFILKDGALFVQAVDAGGDVTSGAVVGGTGLYAGARGTFTSATTKSGANDEVDLLP
jgi:hypothetical protein